MENPMPQYKTIVFKLLKERTELHEQLRKERKLLTTMERYALELKTSHDAWKELLSQMRPGSDPSQTASEALEIALKELEDRLPSASHQDSQDALFLDAAMIFLRPRTSRG
jgi:chromosome condensin MukBEF ATPase and DNA-binding subunit MukB